MKKLLLFFSILALAACNAQENDETLKQKLIGKYSYIYNFKDEESKNELVWKTLIEYRPDHSLQENGTFTVPFMYDDTAFEVIFKYQVSATWSIENAKIIYSYDIDRIKFELEESSYEHLLVFNYLHDEDISEDLLGLIEEILEDAENCPPFIARLNAKEMVLVVDENTFLYDEVGERIVYEKIPEITTEHNELVKQKETPAGTSTSTISDSWIGEWKRDLRYNEAILEIVSIQDASIEFTLWASNGANTGDADGMAKVKNNVATFSSNDCLLKFTLQGDSKILIEETDCSFYKGMGVVFSGEYEKSTTLVELGVLSNYKENSAFKDLVGDKYSLFIVSSQTICDEDDLDGLNAKVMSSWVNGLNTILENIIIIDPSKNIWAAVIDNNKVYYYTNNQSYKNKLPKTIDNWRNRFKDYEVIYEATAYYATRKAFFYNEPRNNTERKAYIVEGDRVDLYEIQDDFGYVEYTSTNGQKTKGWMRMSDLSI